MGNEQRRTGNAHAVIAPYGVFQTLDGPLNLAPITSAIWGRLCVCCWTCPSCRATGVLSAMKPAWSVAIN
ncbi:MULTISPECIES: CoA transferase [Pseudomonas]|uniref:CoA transferase n=1 Tax=Pseudomonas TaxID=286 RepID=UPI002114DF07|nr:MULTISPECIES: CoA transferase [unclassified Pseudomonas]